eukprot:2556596-Prymnesium_polylepis.1
MRDGLNANRRKTAPRAARARGGVSPLCDARMSRERRVTVPRPGTEFSLRQHFRTSRFRGRRLSSALRRSLTRSAFAARQPQLPPVDAACHRPPAGRLRPDPQTTRVLARA